MGHHKVALQPTEGTFKGLAKQNMLVHQCIGELVDNAIAAKPKTQKFRVDIVLINNDEDSARVDLYIADNCQGMTLEHLKLALQLGESATTDNRLNEHGFGLKNALATLSGGNGYWKVWSKAKGTATVSSVEGPFKTEMYISDEDELPVLDFLPSDISTLVKVPVKLTFLQSLQGRGAPAKDLSVLRTWMIEHLGVAYRGYLEQDGETLDSSGVIVVSVGNDNLQVPPILVPFGSVQTKRFKVELSGSVYDLEYKYGTLDEEKRDKIVRGNKAKYYYQGNIATQGIDIRLGRRVIATKQFETIWKTDDGEAQLTRHNNFNDFVGELLIPELPRGVLSTVNNKTDFNLDDPDWSKIFDHLNILRPPKKIREHSENELRNKWISMLRATNPEDIVTHETSVWPTGTYIDVYRRTSSGKIIIYELKVGTGAPIHLYQLKMYWDGLVLDKKEQPSEAILLVEEFPSNLEVMANMMNKLPVPPNSKPYNFKIERLSDKGLITK